MLPCEVVVNSEIYHRKTLLRATVVSRAYVSLVDGHFRVNVVIPNYGGVLTWDLANTFPVEDANDDPL